MGKIGKGIAVVGFIALIGVLALLWLYFGSVTTNRKGYSCIGDIPVPHGYERMKTPEGDFLRSLPLRPKGSKVMLYTGGEARLQSLAYAVIDMPLLSNYEQCADVCMRLRAEYLFNSGRYKDIHFQSVNGETLRYKGGSSRKELERYLRHVYGVANTYSLKREMEQREIADVRPGDVFVYAAGDHDLERKLKAKYGHAIMVVDVATDRKGRKAVLLAEGNTPARDIHLLRNFWNPFSSPWFYLDDDDDIFIFDCFYYKRHELRCF